MLPEKSFLQLCYTAYSACLVKITAIYSGLICRGINSTASTGLYMLRRPLLCKALSAPTPQTAETVCAKIENFGELQKLRNRGNRGLDKGKLQNIIAHRWKK
jgi:hypothetical protein